MGLGQQDLFKAALQPSLRVRKYNASYLTKCLCCCSFQVDCCVFVLFIGVATPFTFAQTDFTHKKTIR